jgi:hypothetical protein
LSSGAALWPEAAAALATALPSLRSLSFLDVRWQLYAPIEDAAVVWRLPASCTSCNVHATPGCCPRIEATGLRSLVAALTVPQLDSVLASNCDIMALSMDAPAPYTVAMSDKTAALLAQCMHLESLRLRLVVSASNLRSLLALTALTTLGLHLAEETPVAAAKAALSGLTRLKTLSLLVSGTPVAIPASVAGAVSAVAAATSSTLPDPLTLLSTCLCDADVLQLSSDSVAKAGHCATSGATELRQTPAVTSVRSRNLGR